MILKRALSVERESCSDVLVAKSLLNNFLVYARVNQNSCVCSPQVMELDMWEIGGSGRLFEYSLDEIPIVDR